MSTNDSTKSLVRRKKIKINICGLVLDQLEHNLACGTSQICDSAVGSAGMLRRTRRFSKCFVLIVERLFRDFSGRTRGEASENIQGEKNTRR